MKREKRSTLQNLHNGIKLALIRQHRDLKVRLWKERAMELFRPKCDYCGRLILHPDDCVAHHWLIRRGRLPVVQQHKIEHEFNISLLHQICSDEYETTVECKQRCARAQYKRYGRETLVAWVLSLGLKQQVEVPE